MRSPFRSAATAEAELLAAVRSRFPDDALVLRSRATRRFRRSLSAFEVAVPPRRDARFAAVATSDGLSLWAHAKAPFLALSWSSIAGVRLRSIDDYLLPDLYTADGGYVTDLLWIASGPRALELQIWGDEERDETGAELDRYGLGLIVERLEALRRSSSAPQ